MALRLLPPLFQQLLKPWMPTQRLPQRIDAEQGPRYRRRDGQQVFQLVERSLVLPGPHVNLGQARTQLRADESVLGHGEELDSLSSCPNGELLLTQSCIGECEREMPLAIRRGHAGLCRQITFR